MKWPAWQMPLPLLCKELVEQAARRRTYIVRVAAAALLFVTFLAFSYREFTLAGPLTAQLGHGLNMFDRLVRIQFYGILIFLPAMMSSALTYEKERQSLGLLLITDLSPNEILFEKFLGRLVPMLSVLLLALPPLAVCYAFGGITTGHLFAGVLVITLACLQIGALALACSSYCRTSLAALIASYLLIPVTYLLTGILFAVVYFLGSIGLAFTFRGGDRGFFALFDYPAGLGGWPLAVFDSAMRSDSGLAFFQAIPLVASTVFLLAKARRYIVKRAMLPQTNELMGFFKVIDSLSNACGFGTVSLLRQRVPPPKDHPVAWREVSKKAFGKPRYLFRIVAFLAVPVLALSFLGLVEHWPPKVLSGWLYVMWVFAALTVSVSSASAIADERANRTLDVLLSTPIPGRDILLQKLSGVRRLTAVLAVPFLLAFFIAVLWRSRDWAWARGVDSFHAPVYLSTSLFSLVAYLPLLCWLGVWVGLVSRTRLRAITILVGSLAVWAAAPPLLGYMLHAAFGHPSSVSWLASLLPWVSPAAMIVAVESLGGTGAIELPMAIHGVACTVIWVAIRTTCLAEADSLLGRACPRLYYPTAPPSSLLVEARERPA